jgi:hypothetical protein
MKTRENCIIYSFKTSVPHHIPLVLPNKRERTGRAYGTNGGEKKSMSFLFKKVE